MITISQLLDSDTTRINRKRHGSRSRALDHCPFKKGRVIRVVTMKPKKPNSAIRKVAKVKLSNDRRATCYIVGFGHDLRPYSDVLVRGRFVKDLPCVQYHMVKGKYDYSWKERFKRTNARSKYGIPQDKNI